jgi:hypothetical protein
VTPTVTPTVTPATLLTAIRRRHPVPASLLGVALAVFLFAGFGVVVQQGVRRGDVAKQDLALRQEATWRCNALRTRERRADCMRRFLEERPGDSPSLQAMVAEVQAP